MATSNLNTSQQQHRSTLHTYLHSHSKLADTVKRKTDGLNQIKTHSSSSANKKEKKPLKLPSLPRNGLSERKSKATFNDSIPDEILAFIFWKLQVGELVSASQVCKRWHKVANDNLLWKHFYTRFFGSTSREKEDKIPIQDLENGCWKNLCLKQCQLKRDKIYLKKWKQPDSYTGLKQRPELSLSKVGVRFELSILEMSGLTRSLTHSDIYWQSMSSSVRWYDLTFPDLTAIRMLRVHACCPIMFNGPSKPAKDGIVQKSLLTEFKGNLKEALKKSNPVGSDGNIILYEIISGLIIALYKADGEIAFISVSYHYHNMISRCLCGTPDSCWQPTETTGVPDDIDPHYGIAMACIAICKEGIELFSHYNTRHFHVYEIQGLHSYTCVLLLRNMRQRLLECKFTDLFTTKSQLNDGFAVFNPVRKDDKMTHCSCPKEINFPWKTNLFKGVVKNVGILDVTLLDERGEPFWAVTSCINVKPSSQTNQFEFDPNDYQVVHYEDDVGKIDLEIGKLDDGEQYLSYAAISVSVVAINKAFNTSY